MKNWKQTILTGLFVVLYLAVGTVSVYHAISFFGIANAGWLAITLACAFEVGQAVVLFALMTDKPQAKKPMPWILMGVLTAVQVIGNIFASYKYMAMNPNNEIQYFIDSVMWFIKDPDPQTNIVIVSYIIGAILPVVALCMTGMIVNTSGLDDEPEPEESKEPQHSDPKIFL